MRAPGQLPHDLQVRGGQGGLPRMPGGHRHLEGVLRPGPVIGVSGGDHGPVSLRYS